MRRNEVPLCAIRVLTRRSKKSTAIRSRPSKPLRKKAVNSSLRIRKLSSLRWLCCIALHLTVTKRGLHGSLLYQFCVDTCAVCERWCRCAPFQSVSILFSAAGRRNCIAFRPYRRTPTAVVSARALSQFLHRCAPQGYNSVMQRAATKREDIFVLLLCGRTRPLVRGSNERECSWLPN
jgi:hypothetical protein